MNTGETARLCIGAAADGPHDDAVSRLKQQVDLIETTFQREILDMKRAGADLIEKNKSIESQLSSLRDETEKLKAKVSQLDEENRRLEAAFKTHIRNMDWEYAAPDWPPKSYWVQQGYDCSDGDDTIADIFYGFFNQAEAQSKYLRRGAFGLNDGNCEEDHLDHLSFGLTDDSSMIRHDWTMDDHWSEFRQSLCLWQLSPVRGTIERTHPICVRICNIELPTNVLNMLRECFVMERLGHMEQLHLERNEFQGSDGVDFALEIVQSQKKMTEFVYVRNPVYNGQDCQILIDAIVSHPNISSCHLECVCGRERNGHDYILDLLRKEEMKEVDFSNCGVTTDSQSTLFDVIKLHPNLAWLSLDDNNLKDEDAIHLADALRYNRTLKTLSLSGNEFTRSGENALWEVIYDDSSLNAVADSNHVCAIEGLDFPSSLFRNDDPESRARKIFSLLRERNVEGTNVYHLEREIWSVDTLKVVPYVLKAAQVKSEDWRNRRKMVWGATGSRIVKDAADLSITYELLRSWNATLFHDGTAATRESDATQI